MHTKKLIFSDESFVTKIKFPYKRLFLVTIIIKAWLYMFIQIRDRFGHDFRSAYCHQKVCQGVILVTVFCGNHDDMLIF